MDCQECGHECEYDSLYDNYFCIFCQIAYEVEED